MLGFSFTYAPSISIDTIVAATRRLLESDGWDRPLRYVTVLVDPGAEPLRRPGMVTEKVMLDVAEEALRSTTTTVLSMSTSARNDETFANVRIRARLFDWSNATHVHSYGARPMEAAGTRNAWLDAALSFARDTSSFQGVVFALANYSDAHREGELLTSVAPGKDTHPMYPEWARMSAVEKQVGTRYVRFPRWGTLYSHAHVAALGGAARIVDVVQPAVVRELPGGVYVQLTDSLDTAQSEEATRKRRAFTELAAPLLPPPLPG